MCSEGRWSLAHRLCLKRLDADSEDADTLIILIKTLFQQKQFPIAAKRIGQLERIRELTVEELYLKGQIASELNAIETAFSCFEACLAQEPENGDYLRCLAQHSLEANEYERFLQYSEQALPPDDIPLHQAILFNRQYLDLTPTEEASRIKQFARHLEHIEPLTPAPKISKSGKIRIGYLSSDFRFHPTYYFIEGVLRCHDRESFEIHCFQTTDQIDLKSRELAELSDHWHELGTMDDQKAAEIIRKAQIDLLIDLTGHMAGARPLIFGYRPAPIQGIWIGWLCAMGFPQSDFRLSDRFADPDEEEDALCYEEVVRIPRGIFTFKLPEQLPEPSPPPCLTNDYITFGSFNNSMKQNDEVISLWGQVLAVVPESRLLLKHSRYRNKRARNRVYRILEQQGISLERIQIVPGSPSNQSHLASYGAMDIALDPFPYNGVTSTCEALVMGVPVLALAGRHHRSRIGVSLLSHLGREEWIAKGKEEFVALAQSWAEDIERLTLSRTRLRDEFLLSPLGDAKTYTLSLEETYRTMCRGQ